MALGIRGDGRITRPMEAITSILKTIDTDREAGLAQVFERLYPELRRIATARLRSASSDDTLTPTVLVGELFLKFSGASSLNLTDRRHLYVCAAKAMRQIVIDHARQAVADKRGGQKVQVTLTDGQWVSSDADWLDLDRALDELAQLDPQLREIVDLKFFAGLSIAEMAELTDTSIRSVNRRWSRARAFLHARLAEGVAQDDSPLRIP